MITGNMTELILGSLELCLNVLLYSRLKLPQKVLPQGLLRMSFVRECNYNFGVDTKVIDHLYYINRLLDMLFPPYSLLT